MTLRFTSAIAAFNTKGRDDRERPVDAGQQGGGALSRDAVRRLASSWWLFLIIGILWILFGMFVLSYSVGSLLVLAVFAGVTFLVTGVTQILAGIMASSGPDPRGSTFGASHHPCW
jgi:hypothetical protein